MASNNFLSQAGRFSIGCASFSKLTKEEQVKKYEQMQDYISRLQTDISQSALELSSEMINKRKQAQKKMDSFVPWNRMAHAYMYKRPLDARDTISLVYPRLNDIGGTTVYDASLSSSAKMKYEAMKRKQMDGDLSSVQMDAFSEAIEEDPEEEKRRRLEERMQYRNSK